MGLKTIELQCGIGPSVFSRQLVEGLSACEKPFSNISTLKCKTLNKSNNAIMQMQTLDLNRFISNY